MPPLLHAHEDALRQLHAYSPVDAAQLSLRNELLNHLEAHADGTRRDCRPDHITASALVVDAAARRVLLGFHARAELWLQMGGHIEDDDVTIAAAALREAVEESGIEDSRLLSETQLRLDRHPAPCAPEARYHLDFQFVALARSYQGLLVGPEGTQLRWCPYDALAEPTDDAVRVLVDAARRALEGRA